MKPSVNLRFAVPVFAVLLLAACEPEAEDPTALPSETGPAPTSLLITNVTVLDGTGHPRFAGSVRIDGDRIEAVGVLEALPGERILDGAGQMLAPGFIDTHSHAERDIFDLPDAVPLTSQGVTTAIVGQDGGLDTTPPRVGDFAARLSESPAAVNFAAFSGHNDLRADALGDDYRRAATPGEIERMEALLLADLEAGALGLSTGLEYDPGIYSERSEVLKLAQLAADHGGRYISHIRSEDRWFDESLDEIIDIGRQTGMPVQISHIKLAMKSLWGQADRVIEKLDAARAEGIDITADIYPYEYWQSNMYVLIPSRDPQDREEIAFALNELAPPDGIRFSRFEPDPGVVRRTLADVAAERGEDPVETYSRMLAASQAWSAVHGTGADMIIARSMTEEDIRTLWQWPHTNLCTDGSLVDLHPRARGSFPRVLGRYVRGHGDMTLEEAVHKMSGLAADHMGIEDRGRIEAGQYADLVLFDPETVTDNATPEDPEALSTGIALVWVNGEPVWDRGAATGRHPGRFLHRR